MNRQTFINCVLSQLDESPIGVSVNLHHCGNPQFGYMVSLPDFERIVDRMDELPDAIDCVLTRFELQHNHQPLDEYYLGIWFNENNDKTYIDISQCIEPFDAAINQATVDNQIAIWGVVERQEFFINDYIDSEGNQR